MEALITSQSELRNRGFRALAEALGWANAVRFLRQYDPGAGDYTEERRTLLPDWDVATLIQKARSIEPEREKFEAALQRLPDDEPADEDKL
jgi:hypothetical protein